MPFALPGVKPNSDEETLFKAMGFIVVQWGCVEQLLDLLVSIVFNISNSAINSKQPIFLTAKTRFIRKNLNAHPMLEAMSSEISPLLERLEKTGQKRNDLIHGAVTSFSPTEGKYPFAKLDVVVGNVPTVRSVLLDESEFPVFTRELLQLGEDTGRIVKKALDIVQKVH